MYRSGDRDSLQVVIPPDLVGGVLTSLHAGPCGGHFGPEKLLKQAQIRFYWLDMASDVTSFCAQCDRCAGRNGPNPKARAPMGELFASEPWEVLSIDFLTDLPLTERGNKHLLVCCDHFTRWVEVFALPDMTAVTVARVLTEEVFSRYGCPSRLHSDCAANFRSQIITELCRIMGIEKSNTTPFHPEGNSRCERVNRTLLDMLSKYLSDNHAEWDIHLPLLMMGYRAQIHRSLGYSPFYLMFGREPKLPVDVAVDAPRVVRSKSAAEYIDCLCEGLRAAHHQALKFSDAGHRRNKRLYDEKCRTFQHAVGDQVMLFCAVAKKGEYHKFARPWKPAVIVSRKGDLYYRVRLENGRTVNVNHNRLKPHPTPPLVCDDRPTPPPMSDDRQSDPSVEDLSPPPGKDDRAETHDHDVPGGVSDVPHVSDVPSDVIGPVVRGSSGAGGLVEEGPFLPGSQDPVVDDGDDDVVAINGRDSVVGDDGNSPICPMPPPEPLPVCPRLGSDNGVVPDTRQRSDGSGEATSADEPLDVQEPRPPVGRPRRGRNQGEGPRPERVLPARRRNPPDRLCLYIFSDSF